MIHMKILHKLYRIILILIAKFRLKLKKTGKTTRPFRYDLSQILYDYTVEVTNRLKGLDLVNRVPEELWMEVRNTVQEVVTKTIAKKKKCNVEKYTKHDPSFINTNQKSYFEKNKRIH